MTQYELRVARLALENRRELHRSTILMNAHRPIAFYLIILNCERWHPRCVNVVIANPGITIRREPALKDLIRDC